MSINAFKEKIQPPKTPKGVGSFLDWEIIETQLKIKFPSDFRDLIFLFGNGGFSEFLWVFNPFEATYRTSIGRVLLAYSELRNAKPRTKAAAFKVFPETGGIFPWGITDNGDTFYWQIDEVFCKQIVLYDGRHSEYETYELDTTDFLAGILTNSLNTRILPRDLKATFSQ